MAKKKEQPKPQSPPDGRGKRPADPNRLAKWIVEESTIEHNKATQPPHRQR